MTKRYYVNGWEESKCYFMQMGRFTEDEFNRLYHGETIRKDGNNYYIFCEDEQTTYDRIFGYGAYDPYVENN